MERFAAQSVRQQSYHRLEIAQRREVIRRIRAAKFLRQFPRIPSANPKRNYRPSIAEHGMTDALSQLIQVLMREREIEQVFPCLRQNRRKRIRGEIVELVDVKVESLPGQGAGA